MTPLILGHRGASARAVENTLPAFRRALADGADGIEYDVQLARNGQALVFHDGDLRRLAGIPQRVDELDLPDLEGIPIGPEGGRTASRIPRLSSVLERIGTLHDLEIKLPDEPFPAAARTALVLACVRSFGAACRAGRISPLSIVSSFDLPALDLVARLDPTVRFGVLVEDAAGWDRLHAWRPSREPAVLALRAGLAPLVLGTRGGPPAVVRRSELWFWNVPESDPVPLLRWRPAALIVDDPLAVRNRLRG